MTTPEKPLWFKICVFPAAVISGYFLLSFLGVITMGFIFIPVLLLIYGAPWALVHYLVWGHAVSRAVDAEANPSTPTDGRATPVVYGVSLALWVLTYLLLFAAIFGWLALQIPGR